MTHEEKTMKTEKIYDGKIINLRIDTVELPGKKYSKREIVEHPGAVGVIPIREDGKIILVRQFRKPVEEILLEIPAGRIEVGEDPKTCALRELKEETGFSTSNVEKLVEMYTTPGFSNEVIHVFVAKDLVAGQAMPDEDEYIELISLSLEEALQQIKGGFIKDSKTIVAILSYKTFIGL